MPAEYSPARIYGVPTVIAVLSMVGLIVALFGDGGWDVAAWLGLCAPVLATAWAVWSRPRSRE